MKNEKEIMKSTNYEEIRNLKKEKIEFKNKPKKIKLNIKKFQRYKLKKKKLEWKRKNNSLDTKLLYGVQMKNYMEK